MGKKLSLIFNRCMLIVRDIFLRKVKNHKIDENIVYFKYNPRCAMFTSQIRFNSDVSFRGENFTDVSRATQRVRDDDHLDDRFFTTHIVDGFSKQNIGCCGSCLLVILVIYSAVLLYFVIIDCSSCFFICVIIFFVSIFLYHSCVR